MASLSRGDTTERQAVCGLRRIPLCPSYFGGQRVSVPATGSIALVAHATTNCSRYACQRCCGRSTTTMANVEKVFNARPADSPNSWSRVNKQVNPTATAADTSSPFESAFQPRFAAVSQDTPSSVNVWTKCTSMLASSSHIALCAGRREALKRLTQALTD
jgi:hypothetical protein